MMNFLAEMNAAPKGEVWLHSSEWTKDWTCSFKGQVNDLKVEISNTAETIEEAVDKTYVSFCNLTNGVRAITSPLLEAPARPEKPVFDTPKLDDDIPF